MPNLADFTLMAAVLRDHVVQQELAHEPSATILKAVRKTTNETVVLQCPTPHSTQTAREFRFLSDCHHRHITPMITLIHTANGPVIVFPFARGGDLFSLLDRS
jgi:serine/threonine protein kinase